VSIHPVLKHGDASVRERNGASGKACLSFWDIHISALVGSGMRLVLVLGPGQELADQKVLKYRSIPGTLDSSPALGQFGSPDRFGPEGRLFC
jgi:hypothetical protein